MGQCSFRPAGSFSLTDKIENFQLHANQKSYFLLEVTESEIPREASNTYVDVKISASTGALDSVYMALDERFPSPARKVWRYNNPNSSSSSSSASSAAGSMARPTSLGSVKKKEDGTEGFLGFELKSVHVPEKNPNTSTVSGLSNAGDKPVWRYWVTVIAGPTGARVTLAATSLPEPPVAPSMIVNGLKVEVPQTNLVVPIQTTSDEVMEMKTETKSDPKPVIYILPQPQPETKVPDDAKSKPTTTVTLSPSPGGTVLTDSKESKSKVSQVSAVIPPVVVVSSDEAAGAGTATTTSATTVAAAAAQTVTVTDYVPTR